MRNLMGIINDTVEVEGLRGVTKHRSLAAVPIAGRYRIIDFMLSNMVNSGIRNVGILTHNKYRSLMDHVKSGREWDLASKKDGLFLLAPTYPYSQRPTHYGDVYYFYNHLDYLNQSPQEYVLIVGNDLICNINYEEIFNFHMEKGGDITVLYKEGEGFYNNIKYSWVELDAQGRVLDMVIETEEKIIGTKFLMGMYIMKKSLLIDIIKGCIGRGYYEVVKDGIVKNLRNYKIYGYPYDGYVAKIDSVKSFYIHNMDLLRQEVWTELFFSKGLIYTKVKDEAPAKYMEGAQVKNSIVANGCLIEGKVENSIIFRGVKIHKGAFIKNSIIMQKSVIHENVFLENVILDKEVCITKEKQIKGQKNYPIVIEKRVVI